MYQKKYKEKKKLKSTLQFSFLMWKNTNHFGLMRPLKIHIKVIRITIYFNITFFFFHLNSIDSNHLSGICGSKIIDPFYFCSFICGQSLVIKLVISYNLTQYLFLLKVNFDKSTIRLYFLLIYSILVKFLENWRSIVMSSINCLNYKFL